MALRTKASGPGHHRVNVHVLNQKEKEWDAIEKAILPEISLDLITLAGKFAEMRVASSSCAAVLSNELTLSFRKNSQRTLV